MQLFSQLATRTLANKIADALSERKMSSDWPILTKLRCKLLRGCYRNLSRDVAKSGGSFCFCWNSQRNNSVAVAKWGVTRECFLATCNASLSIRLMCSAAFDPGLTIGRYELIRTLLSYDFAFVYAS